MAHSGVAQAPLCNRANCRSWNKQAGSKASGMIDPTPCGGRAQVKIPLGIGNLNALLLKQLPNAVEYLALHVVHAVLRVGDPKPQFKFNGTLTEGHDQYIG
jgi:hypothetical protein